MVRVADDSVGFGLHLMWIVPLVSGHELLHQNASAYRKLER